MIATTPRLRKTNFQFIPVFRFRILLRTRSALCILIKFYSVLVCPLNNNFALLAVRMMERGVEASRFIPPGVFILERFVLSQHLHTSTSIHANTQRAILFILCCLECLVCFFAMHEKFPYDAE